METGKPHLLMVQQCVSWKETTVKVGCCKEQYQCGCTFYFKSYGVE
jgi:hypothetical protein